MRQVLVKAVACSLCALQWIWVPIHRQLTSLTGLRCEEGPVILKVATDWAVTPDWSMALRSCTCTTANISWQQLAVSGNVRYSALPLECGHHRWQRSLCVTAGWLGRDRNVQLTVRPAWVDSAARFVRCVRRHSVLRCGQVFTAGPTISWQSSPCTPLNGQPGPRGSQQHHTLEAGTPKTLATAATISGFLPPVSCKQEGSVRRHMTSSHHTMQCAFQPCRTVCSAWPMQGEPWWGPDYAIILKHCCQQMHVLHYLSIPNGMCMADPLKRQQCMHILRQSVC